MAWQTTSFMSDIIHWGYILTMEKWNRSQHYATNGLNVYGNGPCVDWTCLIVHLWTNNGIELVHYFFVSIYYTIIQLKKKLSVCSFVCPSFFNFIDNYEKSSFYFVYKFTNKNILLFWSYRRWWAFYSFYLHDIVIAEPSNGS